MKVNELMINDRVLAYGRPVRVEGIPFGGDGVDVFNNVTLHYCNINNIEPMLITAEILEKNFPDTGDDVFWCWDDREEEENWFEIRIEKDDMDFRMNMRYVHELQHALRLCGIEKEIEL